ncbi:MAG: carboxypeptidase regulatory-like domain-containing protein [Anaerolineae bacterium]|nr:carboxypeptidase regulatory-like domain-containing protein [Anaerolineae bacterium]
MCMLVLGVTFNVQAQNLAGQQCPAWVHDLHTTVGPDGAVYPTWHPPVDPTYGCWFDHEHGSDPRQFVGFSSTGMPAFGYTGKMAGLSEPHEGFKVYVANNDLNGRAWMVALHQGSRGPRRAFVQFHSVDWFVTTTTGQPLAFVRSMGDFGYASPNCTAPGNETFGQFQVIQGSTATYPFSGHQLQRRFLPTVSCATTRVYETWTPIINVANIFRASGTFDIDNPSTVVDPANPETVRYMCEFRSPNENCASWYGTQWSGNKRNIIAPQYVVNNTGASEFYTDAYGKPVAAGTANAIRQFVATTSFQQTPCYCNRDNYRPVKNGLYVPNLPGNDPQLMTDGFPFGPGALGQYPTNTPGAPTLTPIPPTSTPVAPTSTPVAPTNTPVVPTSTPQPTQIPSGASVIVSVNPASAPAGSTVNVTIGVANVTDLYGLQTECTVNPAVLIGAGRSDGDVFNTSNSFFVDTGFQNGSWVVAASRLQPNSPFTGSGAAYTLSYTVNGAGSTDVVCSALAVNDDGQEIPVTVINGSFNGGEPVTTPEPPTQTPIPTVVVPTVEPTVVVPTMEPTIVVPTGEPTVVVPTGEPTVVVPTEPSTTFAIIGGVMAYQNRPDNAGIIVQLVRTDASVIAEVTTGADGAYRFTDVPPGTYGVTAIAGQHLRIGKIVTINGNETVELGKLTLPAGDTDDSAAVDILDASLIGANFNVSVPPAPANGDLNKDGRVDIRDLVLVGSNYGLTAPIVIP